jgi:hypothetical protein
MLYDMRFIIGSLLLMIVSTTVPAYITKAVLVQKPLEVRKHTVPRVLPVKPKEVKLPIKSWRK